MTPASKGQLKRILEAFAQTPEVQSFDLGALDHETEVMSLREDWSQAQIWRSIDWIAGRNASGSSIYIRPARALEAHCWILVDDLTEERIQRQIRAHPPAIIVETSPDNYQSWIQLETAVPVGIRTSIARTLARTYGGDPGGVGGNQFGRLPGTTNRKPSRRLATGQYPFATLRHTGRALAKVEIPEGGADPTTRAPPRGAGESTPEHKGDQSRRDFAVACRLVEAGAQDEEIKRAIQAGRLDQKAQREDYQSAPYGPREPISGYRPDRCRNTR